MNQPRPPRGNILIVDAQPAHLEPLASLLVQQGHRVHSAPSGLLALDAARQTLPDLILLDSSLPDMEASEISELLRVDERTRDIPIIYLVAQADSGRARLLAAGAADYLTTPFQEVEVVARVRTHLELRAIRQQLAEMGSQLEHVVAERAQIEEALREAEAEGQDLLENLKDVIYAANCDGVLTYISPAIESFLGYSPSEVIGRHFREFIHEADLARLGENFQYVLSGHPSANEYRVVTKAGEVRWMRTSSQAAFERDQMTGVQGVLTDITEQKEAEEQIRQQNEFLSRVLESLTHPFYVLDAQDYTIQVANSAARQEERSGQATCYAFSHHRSSPCDTTDHPCPVEEIKRLKKPVTVEHIHYDADGQLRNVEVHGYPLFDQDGNVVRVIEYTLDITARKQAEQDLRDAIQVAEQARREERERRREAERRHRIAHSLADILASLNSDQPLEQILDHIALQARQLLENDAVAIYQLHGETGRLALRAAQGLPAGWLAGTDTALGLDALRQAVELRQPVAVPDLAYLLAAGDLLTSAGETGLYQALLAVPIVVKEEVYGGMSLYYARPRSFSDEEVELAAVFGDQVALAIENARLREQVKQAAATAERSRLARDLHDSVTQALFSASLVAEVLPQVWRRDPEEAQQGLDELRHLTRGALAEMRTMLLELRPTVVAETRLEDLLRQLSEAVTGRVQIHTRLNLEPSPTLPPDVHLTFYRVAQEALHNVVKHAVASQVTVSLQVSPPVDPERTVNWHGQVVLRVSDDGHGFDPGGIRPDQLGLGIMRERAASLGAELAIESQPDHGTEVVLIWHNP